MEFNVVFQLTLEIQELRSNAMIRTDSSKNDDNSSVEHLYTNKDTNQNVKLISKWYDLIERVKHTFLYW